MFISQDGLVHVNGNFGKTKSQLELSDENCHTGKLTEAYIHLYNPQSSWIICWMPRYLLYKTMVIPVFRIQGKIRLNKLRVDSMRCQWVRGVLRKKITRDLNSLIVTVKIINSITFTYTKFELFSGGQKDLGRSLDYCDWINHHIGKNNIQIMLSYLSYL